MRKNIHKEIATTKAITEEQHIIDFGMEIDNTQKHNSIALKAKTEKEIKEEEKDAQHTKDRAVWIRNCWAMKEANKVDDDDDYNLLMAHQAAEVWKTNDVVDVPDLPALSEEEDNDL